MINYLKEKVSNVLVKTKTPQWRRRQTIRLLATIVAITTVSIGIVVDSNPLFTFVRLIFLGIITLGIEFFLEFSLTRILKGKPLIIQVLFYLLLFVLIVGYLAWLASTSNIQTLGI